MAVSAVQLRAVDVAAGDSLILGQSRRTVLEVAVDLLTGITTMRIAGPVKGSAPHTLKVPSTSQLTVSRRPGRRPKATKADALIKVYATEKQREELQAAADAEGRTLSGYMLGAGLYAAAGGVTP
jgi:hypothetical protein